MPGNIWGRAPAHPARWTKAPSGWVIKRLRSGLLQLLQKRRPVLDSLAETLMAKESIGKEELTVCDGRAVPGTPPGAQKFATRPPKSEGVLRAPLLLQ